ncbi:MAG: SH3 domain-containing protein [Spirochaetota bacterium]|nr:SH3 domain-containing protein [Spirochaetota bacterium]
MRYWILSLITLWISAWAVSDSLAIKADNSKLERDDLARVTGKGVALRTGASTKVDTILSLQTNDIVKILRVSKKESIGEHGEHYWYKVQRFIGSKWITGWVYGAFLEKVSKKPYSLRSSNTSSDGKLYPIGWSRDGKFAYIHIQWGTTACEMEGVLQIMDFNTNKVIWRKGDCFINPIQEYWLKEESTRLKTFKKLIKKHHIIPITNYRLKSFPLKHNNKLYQVAVSHKIKNKKEYGQNQPYISEVSVYLTTNGKRKKLHSEVFSLPNSLRLSLIKYNNKAIPEYGTTHGYIKSPYEDRIAIVRTGYDTHDINGELLVIGAKLD